MSENITFVGTKLNEATVELLIKAGAVVIKTGEDNANTGYQATVQLVKDGVVYLSVGGDLVVKTGSLKDAREGDTITFTESGEIVAETLVERKPVVGKRGGSCYHRPNLEY